MSKSSQLSESDLERLRRALVREREGLLTKLRVHRDDQRGVAMGEIEDGDTAEQVVEQDGALRQAAFDAPLLSDVERAIEKLDAGTYGVSEDSGVPIPLARLEAVPWARRTVEEEERHRRGATRQR